MFLWQGGTSSEYNWQWYRLQRVLLPGWRNDVWTWGPLVGGLKLTLILAAISAPIAGLIGLIVAIGESSRFLVLRMLAAGYVELIRNTPLLVQLYLLYFMFANFFNLERVTSGILALALFEGAFAAEIFRAGFNSIPTGQRRAAMALGFNRLQSFRLIYLPQSLPLIMPPLAGLFVALIKHSSIVSVVALPELTDIARNLIADTFLTFEIWLTVAAVYIFLCFSVSTSIRIWEKRLLSRLGTQQSTAR